MKYEGSWITKKKYDEILKEMGEKGRKMAIRFGLDSMVQKIDQLYLKLLRENMPSGTG